MLSPTPFSLLCALLLCFPLAIIFTTTTTDTTYSGGASIAACSNGNTSPATPTIAATVRMRPLKALVLPYKATQRLHRNFTTNSSAVVTAVYNATQNLHRNFTTTTTNSSTVVTAVSNATAYGESKDYYYDKEDMELFKLAGRARPYPDKGKNQKKKVAFMFLTTGPLPFEPLWEFFFRHAPPDLYNIYVHADPRFNYTPPLAGVFSGKVIPSKPTKRHTPTLIAAARRLLSRALLHDEANYMFALLTPSCIPLRSFSFTHGFLSRSRKSFIEILENEPGAYYRWMARGEVAMIPELPFKDFRIGSQFFVLNRKHALAVARDVQLWSKFRLPCRKSHIGGCYPEEHYFPSLLNKVDPTGCIPATLTAVDWKGSFSGHPRLYKSEDVGPELIEKLRNKRPRYGGPWINGSDSWGGRHDPFLFARKFAADSLWPLMAIADEFLFID